MRLKGAASAAAKEAVCLALCGRSFASGRTIIFCKTKTRAHRLKILFGLAKLPPAGGSSTHKPAQGQSPTPVWHSDLTATLPTVTSRQSALLPPASPALTYSPAAYSQPSSAPSQHNWPLNYRNFCSVLHSVSS